MEQLHYNLLFRWFVGFSMADAIWAPTTFSKNRDRLHLSTDAEVPLPERPPSTSSSSR